MPFIITNLHVKFAKDNIRGCTISQESQLMTINPLIYKKKKKKNDKIFVTYDISFMLQRRKIFPVKHGDTRIKLANCLIFYLFIIIFFRDDPSNSQYLVHNYAQNPSFFFLCKCKNQCKLFASRV